MLEISEQDKENINNQFIKWIGNKYVKTTADINSVVSINEYNYFPNYKIDIAVKYEMRNFIFDRIKPYNGERIPKNVASLLGKWDYNLDSNNEMKKSENYYSIDNSFEKIICPSCQGDSSYECSFCNGNGSIKCDNCNGWGELRCGNCNGKGEVRCDYCNGRGDVDCRRCNGTGKEKCYKCNGHGYNNITIRGVKKQERCQKCNGSGKIPCSSCEGRRKEECYHCSGKGFYDCSKCDATGKIKCPDCNGNGDNICSNCNGEGILYCNTCNGSSNVLKYTEIKQKYEVLRNSGYFFNTSIPEKLKNEIIHKESFSNDIHKNFKYEDKTVFTFIESQDTVIQELLRALFNELKTKTPNDSKIDTVDFSIQVSKVFLVEFTYSNKKFKWYTYNSNVFFEQGDIPEQIHEELNLYLYNKFCTEKRYVDAYSLIKEICKTKAEKKSPDLRDYKLQEKKIKKIISKDKDYRQQLKTQKYLEKKERNALKDKSRNKSKTVKIKTEAKPQKKNNGCLSFMILLLLAIGVIYYCSADDKTKTNATENASKTSICNCEQNDRKKIIIETDNYCVHYDSNTCFVLHSNYTHKTYKESKEVNDNLGFKEICERNGYTLYVKTDKTQYIIHTPKARYYLIE